MIFLSHLCYNMILLKQTEIWKRFYAKHLQSKYRRHQSADRHTLSPDWQEILEDIIPQLDEESQTIVKNTILSPKGITYSKSTGKFFAKKPETLAQILQSSALHNKQLIKVAHLLQDIYKLPPRAIHHNPMMHSCSSMS